MMFGSCAAEALETKNVTNAKAEMMWFGKLIGFDLLPHGRLDVIVLRIISIGL